MARKVAQAQAEKIIASLNKQWGVDPKYGGPELLAGWDGHDFVIIWEGGPYDWTILASGGGFDEFGHEYEPVKLPTGVWVEPVNGCVLALYRI